MVIERAILHILNNKDDDITLADFKLELTPRVISLLKSHIDISINDEGTRIAKFQNEINVVRDNCKRIFDDDENFISCSKEISRYLFDAMKHPSISPSNFVVCVYRVETEKYVALLKMDFSDVAQTVIENIDGKIKVKIVISGSGVPTDKEKLQKCVFIKTINADSEFDLILLDKQARRSNSDNVVASFFVNSFLHCRLTRSDWDNTKDFKKVTEKFIDKYIEDEEKAQDLKTLLVSTLRGSDSININDFSNTFFGENEELKIKFRENVSEKLGDFNFTIDKKFVREKLRSKKIRTNTGITLDMDIDTFEDNEKFQIVKFEDKKEVDLVIKNVTFSEKYH